MLAFKTLTQKKKSHRTQAHCIALTCSPAMLLMCWFQCRYGKGKCRAATFAITGVHRHEISCSGFESRYNEFRLGATRNVGHNPTLSIWATIACRGIEFHSEFLRQPTVKSFLAGYLYGGRRSVHRWAYPWRVGFSCGKKTGASISYR